MAELRFLKTKWGVFIFIIFCERHRKQENLEITYLLPHYLPDWPLLGQGFTIWPLFKSTKFTARGKSFYYPITMRWREKGDRGVCGWEIRACMRLRVLQKEAECVSGSKAQVSGFYLLRHCLARPSKLSEASIWQTASEKILYRGIGVA